MTNPTLHDCSRPHPTKSRHDSVNNDLQLNYAATIANVRAEILKELAGGESKTTAVSVALVDGERLLWAEAFGLDPPDRWCGTHHGYPFLHCLLQQDDRRDCRNDTGGSGAAGNSTPRWPAT